MYQLTFKMLKAWEVHDQETLRNLYSEGKLDTKIVRFEKFLDVYSKFGEDYYHTMIMLREANEINHYLFHASDEEVLSVGCESDEIIHRIVTGMIDRDDAISRTGSKNLLLKNLITYYLRTRDNIIGNYFELFQIGIDLQLKVFVSKPMLLAYGTDEEKDTIDFNDFCTFDFILVDNLVDIDKALNYLDSKGIDFTRHILVFNEPWIRNYNSKVVKIVVSLLDYIKDFSFIERLTNPKLIEIINLYTSQV